MAYRAVVRRGAYALALCALVTAACIEGADRTEVPDTWGIGDTTGLADTLVGVPPESLVAAVDRTAADSVGPGVTAAEGDEAALGRRLIIPVAGVQASELRDTFTESRGSRPHDAIDIPAPRGTPVLSATGGKLMKLHNSVPGGLMVYAADETDSFILMYGHLDAYATGLVEGMPLRQGQLLGYVGTTGNAPPGTPHLHFAIARGKPSVSWWRGTAINPYPLLRGGPAVPVQ